MNEHEHHDHASKTKGLVWLMAACLLGTGFALGLSPLAHAIPWSWEKKLAFALDSGSGRNDCISDAQAHALMKRLVSRIYPVSPEDAAFSIHVQAVSDPAVNAYAQLGGDIVINSGLLKQAESPEEIAGVLAHEIGHIQNRHILQGVIIHFFTAQGINSIFGGGSSSGEWAHYFIRMDFTRAQEAQADEAGLTRLQRAHVSNEGFRQFFERMGKSGAASAFLSDHPTNEARMEMTEQFSNRDAQPIMTAEEWRVLKHACDGK